MSFTLYQITVPSFITGLKTLSHLLAVGTTHVTAANESTLTESRLIADMGNLVYQVQRVSDTSKGLAVRLGKATPVAWADDETTFPQLHERISKTIAFLETLDPKSMDGMENAEITIGPRKMIGSDYVFKFAVPNFYFHLSMAYAILRKEGVPVGKQDFLGAKN